jgi:hypothetical protein
MHARSFAGYLITAAFAAAGCGYDAVAPRAAKHVNVVTPEAKAAIERYQRLVWRPAEHGLAKQHATLGGKSGTARTLVVDFAAPQTLTVNPAPGVDPMSTGAQMGMLEYGPSLRVAFLGMPIADVDEYDAAFADRDGRRVLVVTEFHGQVQPSTSELEFDGAGLLVEVAPVAGPVTRPHMTLSWASTGDLHRVVGIQSEYDESGLPMQVRSALIYGEFGGVQTLASLSIDVTLGEGTHRRDVSSTIRLSDLVVNGRDYRTDGKPASTAPSAVGGK